MDWQVIFRLSKVNGAPYSGDRLPYQNWKWPNNTWLQQKRSDMRHAEIKKDFAAIQRLDVVSSPA